MQNAKTFKFTNYALEHNEWISSNKPNMHEREQTLLLQSHQYVWSRYRWHFSIFINILSNFTVFTAFLRVYTIFADSKVERFSIEIKFDPNDILSTVFRNVGKYLMRCKRTLLDPSWSPRLALLEQGKT